MSQSSSKRFSLKSINGKFFFTTLAAVVALVLILFSFIFYKSTSDRMLQHVEYLEEGLTDIVLLRRAEKDFMSRTDLTYRDTFNKTYERLLEKLKFSLGELENFKDRYEKLLKQVAHYKILFDQIVKEYETVGLDENSGLKGGLRGSIHKAEEKVSELNNLLLYKDMLQLRRKEKDFFLRRQVKYVDDFKTDLGKMLNDIDSRDISQNDKTDLKKLLEDYQVKFLQVAASYQKIGLTHKEGIQMEIRQLMRIVTPQFEAFLHELRDYEGRMVSLYTLIVYISMGLLLLMLIIQNMVFKKSIVTPIEELVENMTALSEGIKNENSQGDLTRRIEVKKDDEMGQLLQNYNYLMGALQQNFATIKQTAGVIADSSEEIAGGSRDLALRTNEQASSVTETSATLEQLSNLIRSGSENIETVTVDLDRFGTEVQGKTGHIEEVTQTMQEIEASGEKIDDIVTVINDISFQTNLLALNAAVEAARAGEAGRGFAVVAAEVRNLAQKTAESSKTIQEIVTQNVETTHKGMTLVQETAAFFESIVKNIQAILERLRENSEGLKEQTTGIDHISAAVTQLDRAVTQNAQLAEELSTTTEGIKANSGEMEIIVGQYHVDENEARRSTPGSTPGFTPSKKKGAPAERAGTQKRPAGKPVQEAAAADDNFFGSTEEDTFEEF